MNMQLSPAPLGGTIRAIPSKSHAHRLLICAALADGVTEIDCRGSSRDIEATAACMRAIGACITEDARRFTVTPGILQSPCRLPCGESGSTLRFLLPVAAALGLEADFVMEGRLPQRPLAPLDAQLQAHGVCLQRPAPDVLHVSGRLQPGAYTLPGNVSSQYISGLLFALPLLAGESTLTVTGTVESAPYIAMTLAALAQFGISVECSGQTYRIRPGRYRSPGRAQVEGDWSNAAFWLCAGALGATVSVTGLLPESLQGDKAVVGLLARFGAETACTDGCYTVSPGPLHGIEIDAAAIPDLVPVLAVVAAAAEGDTRFFNAGRLRLKESDRIASVLALLQGLGVPAEETADGLIVHGGGIRGGTADSFQDHRIAMAAAVASVCAADTVTVTGARAVEKSYPGFWEDFEFLRKAEEKP